MAQVNLELEQYDKFISSLYEAARDTKSWSQPLEQLRVLFKANYVTLILKLPTEDDLGLVIAVGGDLEGEQSVRYLPSQHNLTPFADQPADKVLTVSDLMDEKDWQESTYRQHWCAPHDVYHVMATDISTPDVGNLRFRVTRGQAQEDFSLADKELCKYLNPHLRQAISTQLQLHSSQSLGALYSRAIGRLSIATVTIDEHGRVLDKNLFASYILKAGDGLKLMAGKLTAHYSSDNRELKRLIKTAFEQAGTQKNLPEAMAITRPSGEIALGVVIEVIPSLGWADGKGQGKAVVYIRDAVGKSQTSREIFKKLFGLTHAETTLSLKLTNGLSLEEAAKELGIRRNTARAHLRSIFSKTGVRRQTELVRMFLNSVAALGNDDNSTF